MTITYAQNGIETKMICDRIEYGAYFCLIFHRDKIGIIKQSDLVSVNGVRVLNRSRVDTSGKQKTCYTTIKSK